MLPGLLDHAARINSEIRMARTLGRVPVVLTTAYEVVAVEEVRVHEKGDFIEARTTDDRWVVFIWYDTARR